MIRRKVHKIFVLFLMLCMMFNLCACTVAKDIKDNIENRMDINTNTLSSQEIVRLMIDAINKEDKMAESYSAIPERQLDGVSYSMYFEYINIFRSITNNYGKEVSYFRMIPHDDVKELVGADVFNVYPGLVAAELQYSDKNGRATSFEDPLYIFLTEKNGQTNLSLRWVSGVVDIYNYGDHYITMLDEQSSDGVYALIEPGLKQVLPERVVKATAQSLVEYYRVSVKSASSQYGAVMLTPSYYSIRVPDTIGENDTTIEHFIEIKKDASNVFHINDDIPFYLDSSMLYLTSGQNGDEMHMLNVGATYSRDTLIFNLGNPKYEFVRTDDVIYLDSEAGDGKPMRRTVTIYPSVNLIFFAEHKDKGGDWTGVLQQINITGEDYHIGNNIHVGMSKYDLLEKYPFMFNSGYEYYFSNETGNYKVTLVFGETDVLEEIIMSKEF
ncbi:MAG: hypothetical protein MJ108_05380 [Saccharofermentans sp.]|nr:hypothetical protein [Saccharofermentans sp.]